MGPEAQQRGLARCWGCTGTGLEVCTERLSQTPLAQTHNSPPTLTCSGGSQAALLSQPTAPSCFTPASWPKGAWRPTFDPGNEGDNLFPNVYLHKPLIFKCPSKLRRPEKIHMLCARGRVCTRDCKA